MDDAIDTLEERYGSVGGYLSAELSVGPAQIERLRDMFLV
jgi:protein tyrosine/serine phosphatase